MKCPSSSYGITLFPRRSRLFLLIQFGAFFLYSLTSLAPVAAQQKLAALTGIVTDALDGLPLHGATVVLSRDGIPGTFNGTATNANGRFQIVQIRPGRYRVTIRYVGYEEINTTISLNPAQSLNFDASLEQSRNNLNTVVVSASRQQEKVLDAISSISVVPDHKIQSDVTVSSASSLRHITGVDIAQTGIDRRELSLRGFNNSVTGETYVLTDYRLSAVPGLAVNAYGLMPIATLDVGRIEIVRGPGSALYGSGVDQGLLHFVTKDPFSYPGTSVSIGGGERGLFHGELRHAGVVNEKLGYKVVGEYSRGNDWTLDPGDAIDQDLIAIEGGVPRDDEYWKYGINGVLEYRFNEQVKLIGNGGYLSQKMALLTGIGAAQTDNFSYTYGQLRLHAGNFFAQAYLNQNDSGQSYYYGPTTLRDTPFDIVDHTLLVNGQAQYNVTLLEGREQLLIGTDYKLTLPKTAGTVHGRNEDIDRIEEVGGYLQSSTLITEAVHLTAALRADYNNIAQEIQLSPRAGMLFKITPRHTFRVTANRAFGAPGLNPNFLDLRVAWQGIYDPFGLVLQGRGAHEGFTFNTFRDQQQVTFLLPDTGDLGSARPSLFGQMVPLDRIPIIPVFETFNRQFETAVTNGAALPAPLNRLNAADRAIFARLISQLTPFVQGNTAGALGVPALTEEGFRIVDNPVDIAPLKQTITNSLEAGYKGAIGSRIFFSADVYFTQKKNFVGPLLVESPFVFLTNLDADLLSQLDPMVTEFSQADPELNALLQNIGLSATETAGLIANLAANGFADAQGFANTPVAIVQPDQALLPSDTPSSSIGGLLTYRNFGDVSLWGVDIALEYFPSDRLQLFSSASFVSDDFFDNTELHENDANLAVALNAPTFKTSAGFDYQLPIGLSFKAAGRYVHDFPVISGPFIGQVESYTVIDGGMGYDFGRQISGLRLDLTAQNLLTFVGGKQVSTHREFVGAPRIGRILMARIVFTF